MNDLTNNTTEKPLESNAGNEQTEAELLTEVSNQPELQKPKNKGGRPKQDLAKKVDFDRLQKLVAAGLTDKQLAVVFSVNEKTITNWKEDPRFVAVLKKGKGDADARVERSLWERATGYDYKTTKTIRSNDGKVIVHEIVEHVPPDPTAMIFWLKNRKPAEWRDRREVAATININEVNFTKLTVEELSRVVREPEKLLLSTQN